MKTDMLSNLSPVSGTLLIVVVFALAVGAFAAPIAWGSTAGPDGSVMVVSVDTTLTEATADEIKADLREARADPEIGAVVLQLNSPGGTVPASEGLFFAVERTAEEMPVMANVQSMAASGGYYMVAPADEIFVKPGSMVGSIGVRATFIDAGQTQNEIITGPDKNSGYTEAELRQQIESMQQSFITSVTTHRSDELTISESELANAKVYAGAESVNNGLADSIGDSEVAISAAADQAGYRSYEIENRSHSPAGLGGILLESETDDSTVTVETPTFLALYGTIDVPTADNTSSVNETATADGGEADA